MPQLLTPDERDADGGRPSAVRQVLQACAETAAMGAGVGMMVFVAQLEAAGH